MVIGKGSSYGFESSIDPTWPTLGTDAQLARHIAEKGSDPCTITGGDLLATLGGGAPAGVSHRAYPVDLLEIELEDGSLHVAAAHVVVRRRLWAGVFLAAMNAAYVDGLYLGPRSHPNDGLVDTTVGQLGLQQRLMAKKRAITGVHLPHPGLKMTRKPEVVHSFERGTPVRVDGVLVGETTRIKVVVRPDAGLVVV